MSDSEDDNSDNCFSDADEAHDLVGGGGSDAEESEPEPEPAAPTTDGAAKADATQPSKLFVPYYKGYYQVPMVDLKKNPPVKEGCTRCYNRPAVVQDGAQLGEIIETKLKAWPKGEELKKLVSADKIVVLNGKFIEKEKGSDTTRTVEDCNIWYLLFEVEGSSGTQDAQILRHIPKATYLEIMEEIKTNKALKGTSLLKTYAYNNNDKSFNPEHNNWIKVPTNEGPKSAAIAPAKEPKEPKDGKKAKNKDTSSADGAKKQSASLGSFWNPRGAGESEGGGKNSAGEAKEPNKPKEASEAKEPSEPKNSASEAKEPKPKEAEKPKNVEKPAAAAPAAPGNKRVTFDQNDDLQAPKDADKQLFKRRRTSVVEEHSFVICESGIHVDFPAPAGATSGTATITWSFD